jgi:PIN domain nuclease of toxin-antitoxin system
MKLLLDAHVWLWWQLAPERLSAAAMSSIERGQSVFLSAVSSWEMAIKIGAGKLQLPKPLEEMVPESLTVDGFINLPIQPLHCFELVGLPMHHRDPFDRMLVAQARSESLQIVTADRAFAAYDVPLLVT